MVPVPNSAEDRRGVPSGNLPTVVRHPATVAKSRWRATWGTVGGYASPPYERSVTTVETRVRWCLARASTVRTCAVRTRHRANRGPVKLRWARRTRAIACVRVATAVRKLGGVRSSGTAYRPTHATGTACGTCGPRSERRDLASRARSTTSLRPPRGRRTTPAGNNETPPRVHKKSRRRPAVGLRYVTGARGHTPSRPYRRARAVVTTGSKAET